MEANMNLKKLDTIKTPENWKRELLEQQKITKESSNTDFMKIKRMKWAMASLVLIVVCTMGITVGADTSNPFGEFLQSVFGTKKVQEVHLETTSNIGETNAYKEYEEPGAEIQLSNNMEIVGRNETFILEYNKEDSEKVKSVYCIKNSQLTSEQVNRFQGKYDGKDFSFDYVIKNNEICGFNYNGAVSEVFPVMEERTVYVALYQTKEDTVIKETIAKINLDTDEIIKLSNDKMICNFVLSPNGKTLLCNFRTKGYWSVFDLKNKTEKKIKKSVINGYATTDEIVFVDDYHILTLGKAFTKNKTEYYSKYLVNLKSGKVEKEYFNTQIDINFNWTYMFNKNILTIENVMKCSKFQINIQERKVEPIIASEKYAIFGDASNKIIYLINLEKEEWMKLKIPNKEWENMEFYLMSKENKMLITLNKKAYIIDLSKLKKV